MFTVRRRKTFVILALLLVCTIVAALLECQVHAESSADEHTAAPGQATPMSHHGSSPHVMGQGLCLIAVLPTTIPLVWSVFARFHLSRRLVSVTSFALPPFIPPRAAAH